MSYRPFPVGKDDEGLKTCSTNLSANDGQCRAGICQAERRMNPDSGSEGSVSEYGIMKVNSAMDRKTLSEKLMTHLLEKIK